MTHRFLRRGFVKVADAFSRHEVQLGQANATHIVVFSGIDEGDEVALSPPHQLVYQLSCAGTPAYQRVAT